MHLSSSIPRFCTFESSTYCSTSCVPCFSSAQVTAQQTASSAQLTLRTAEGINADLTASIGRLRVAEQLASDALAVQLPSIATITNLSSQMNSTIVPEATVNQTLEDVRTSLREAESILRIAQSAL